MSAATVGALAAVASVGVSAYGKHQQAKSQKEAAAMAAQAQKEGLYGSKTELGQFNDSLGPDSITGSMWEGFNDSLPLMFEATNSMNAQGITQRNKTAGGRQFTDVLRKEGSNIESMLKGEIPTDVADSITRTIAERMGGSFNPSVPGGYAGGISQTGSALSRSLGLTSVDIMNKGHGFASDWTKRVDAFTYKPSNAVQDSGAFLSAAQLQLQRDKQRYEAETNTAIAESQPDPQVVGSVNDSMRSAALRGQAEANEARAMAGLITAGTGAATSIYNANRTQAPTARVLNNVPYGAGASQVSGYNYNPATGYSKA